MYIKLEVYPPEFREEICRLVIEGNRSATSVAEKFGIDKNTVCSWVRNYRRAHPLPSYAEEQGIMKSVREEESELKRKNIRYCIGQKLIVESKSNNCNELSLQKHRHQSICKRVLRVLL